VGAGKVEVFETKAIELRVGDMVQFTSNHHEAGRPMGLAVQSQEFMQIETWRP